MTRTGVARIGYTVTTPESVEYGDYAEYGWWLPGGWEYPLRDSKGQHPDILERGHAGEFDLTVGEGIRAALDLGATQEIQLVGGTISSRSINPLTDRANIERGESRYYVLHITGVSAGTLARIKRLLEG